jgi:hypothetical protein
MKIKSLVDFSKTHGTNQMTEKQTALFVNCMLADQQAQKSYRELDAEAFRHQSTAILKQRLEWSRTDVSHGCFLFVASMCDRPGKIVMWAYALAHMAEIIKVDRMIGMNDFAEYFPMGVPSEDAQRRCWEHQKQEGAPNSNLLDELKNWQ